MGLIYQSKDTSWVTVFENNEQYTLGKELHQEYNRELKEVEIYFKVNGI